jgi:hypothetical protein
VDRRVFINYRGEDSNSYGALLYTDLIRRFGEDLVFLDCESIPAGADFVTTLLERVRTARVVLAVIGPRWLISTPHRTDLHGPADADRAGDPVQQRRIDDPADWIRRELAVAFASGVRVIPVLTDHATLPTAAELPADIAALSHCQARPLRRREPVNDLARIAADLIGVDPDLAAAARKADRGAGYREPVAVVVTPIHPVPDPGTDGGGEVFVGREAPVRALLAALNPAAATPTPDSSDPAPGSGLVAGSGAAGGAGAVVVSAVAGMGGIGKTALARQAAAHAVTQGWFPGGAIWADLRGYDPDTARMVTPEVVYAPLLRALGLPGQDIPPTPAEQVTVYHQLLRRLAEQQLWVLLVLDNTAATTQLEGLLPVGGDGLGHRVVITTRDALVLPAASARLEVGVFTSTEARLLWRTLLMRCNPHDPRLGEDHTAVADAVLAACGWLPLAVAIAAGIAIAEPDLALTDLAAELADQAGRLDTLTNDQRVGVPHPSLFPAGAERSGTTGTGSVRRAEPYLAKHQPLREPPRFRYAVPACRRWLGRLRLGGRWRSDRPSQRLSHRR